MSMNTWEQKCPLCHSAKFVGKITRIYKTDAFFCSKCCFEFEPYKEVLDSDNFKKRSTEIKERIWKEYYDIKKLEEEESHD